MEKAAYLIFLGLLISFLAANFLYGTLTGMFVGFGPPSSAVWWNTSWDYRLQLEINSSQYSRTDWPVEYTINFTDNLPSGTFDANSVRLVEYSGSSILYEVPSQFDPGGGYDSSNNAVGELVFLMNGTTAANSNRTYYLYYDIVESGAKDAPNYVENINYSTGQDFEVNNSYLRIFIDTERGENTSGMSRIQDIYENVIFYTGVSDRTGEYLEYSNYSHNVSFDLVNNASFTNGPVRLTIEQIGEEILFGDISTQTGEAYVNKKYYIYDRVGPQQYGTFIKIRQRITNSAGSQIQRNSTPSGALAFDLERTLNSGSVDSNDANTTNPFSWSWGSGSGGEMVGICQLEQTGTSNYHASDDSQTAYGRVGVKLDDTSINSGSYIEQLSLIYFSGTGGSDGVTEFYNIIGRYETPIEISQSLPERWYVVTEPATNSTTYNRNETLLVNGNLSATDPYNLTQYMNATFDMGTASTSDDQTIVLYDDGLHDDYASGDKIFGNTFQIPNNGNVTQWFINLTSYDSNNDTLNYTIHNFNVTDEFSVNVTVIDKKPIADAMVRANVSVQNFQETDGISGAIINCSINGVAVVNKTETGNGNYSVNFSAPSSEGIYTLYCNATKNNNLGTGNDTLTVEASKVNMTIGNNPSEINVTNITTYQNETFELVSNFSVIGTGTAYSTNVTIAPPSGWTSEPPTESCNNIDMGGFCNRTFNITIPENTTPGLYLVNVTVEWGNPDSSNSSNQTTVNVTVDSNPQINISTLAFFAEAGDGANMNLGNFSVTSVGNSILQNVTLGCYQGTVCTDFIVNFTPPNISSLDVNITQDVGINITVPLAYAVGNYVGYVNVSAENDNYKILELNITVPQSTNVNISFEPSVHIAYYVTVATGENFTLNITLENTENASARYPNMSIVVPTNWTSSSYLEYCNNLTRGENCTKEFNISIQNGTAAGNYLLNVTTNWTNTNNSLGSFTRSLNVTVASVPLIGVYEQYVNNSVGDGEEKLLGNFTVLSVGNGMIQTITFDCYQGTVCTNFNPEFNPSSIASIQINENQSVLVNVTVPLGFIVGNYTGKLNVSAANDNYTIIDLNVTVPSNKTWGISTTFCQKSEFPDEGTACEVVIYNLGNDNITMNISPEEGNYTKVNITNFIAIAGTNYTFNVTYNVTNVTQAPYNSTFSVDALDSDASPDNSTLIVSLLPYQPPEINFTIIPNETEQNGTVVILANITDKSTSGMKWVNATIYNPEGYSNTTNMTLYNSSGDTYNYNLSFPDGIGSTYNRGEYMFLIVSEDNIGNVGNKSKNFTVYTNLVISSAPISSSYFQGDTGSIFYSVKNLTGYGLSNVNVSFKIYDSTENVSYSSDYQSDFDGYIAPMPKFELSSDAVTGNYTLVTNSTYYDSYVGTTVTKQINATFQVQERTVSVTGLFAEMETSVIWYPDNEMRFMFLIYNGEGRPVDPDSMNLTIFDPSEDLYREAAMDATWKRSAGYYVYDFIMPPTTVNGMYMAFLNVSQGQFFTSEIKVFRVAQGGPYDVKIDPFEYEVEQGDFFDFEVTVINMGSVSQDVFIEYNVTNEYFNQSYYYASEAVYTPGNSNQSFTRTAYVFSNQPLGTYRLTAKVTFDYIQPSIIANTTFQVIEGQEPYVPPSEPPSSGPTGLIELVEASKQKLTASLIIMGYNSNVSLARGFRKIESVTVKNDGRNKLNNVSLFVLGIPTEWFTITPENYEYMDIDDTAVFLIEYSVPENVIPGDYRTSLLATSGVVSDQKTISLTVYESMKELLEKELKKLKEELLELKVDTKVAEREGKDVTNVNLFINMIESYIEDAENDIENNRHESAMDKISNALGLIRKARDILNKLEAPEFIPPSFSLWMLLFLFIVIIVIVFAVAYWKRKKLEPVVRPYMAPLSKLVENMRRKEVSSAVLDKERSKMTRMLSVLERQKEEGLISTTAYRKMKKNMEQKLEKIK